MNLIKKTGRFIAVAVIFSAVVIMMAVYFPFNTLESGAAKITEADIQAVKDKISANEKKIAEYEAKIDSLGKDIENATAEKEQLDQQIHYIQSNIDDTAELIEKYEVLIKDKEIQIADRENQISQKYNDFLERLRISYEDGTQNYLELLVSSENLIDFITRVDNLGSVLTYEQTLMDELEQEVSDLDALKSSLSQKKNEYEELGAYQNESQNQLSEKLQAAEKLIAQLEKDEAAAKKAQQDAAKKDAALDDELKKLLKEYEEQQIAEAKGALLWPVDSNYRTISSKYGWRILWGEKDFHLGVDIPAKYGSNIYAANNGKVLKALYNSSYGYYILIDHGGNKATLYAHCSKLLVKAGDKVERGQVIAKIGSTGNSSGYHLHFEVRINGSTTNPLVKNMLVINNNGKMVDPVAKGLLKYS